MNTIDLSRIYGTAVFGVFIVKLEYEGMFISRKSVAVGSVVRSVITDGENKKFLEIVDQDYDFRESCINFIIPRNLPATVLSCEKISSKWVVGDNSTIDDLFFVLGKSNPDRTMILVLMSCINALYQDLVSLRQGLRQ